MGKEVGQLQLNNLKKRKGLLESLWEANHNHAFSGANSLDFADSSMIGVSKPRLIW